MKKPIKQIICILLLLMCLPQAEMAVKIVCRIG